MRYVEVPDFGDSGALHQRVPVAEPVDPSYPTPRLPDGDPWASAVNRAIDEIHAEWEAEPEPEPEAEAAL